MTESNISESAIREAVEGITDPEIGRSLGELNMIKNIKLDNSDLTQIEVELPTPAYPKQERITEAIQKTLSEKSLGNAAVQFSYDVKGKNTGGGLALKSKTLLQLEVVRVVLEKAPSLPVWLMA